jgi:hypothetical protein
MTTNNLLYTNRWSWLIQIYHYNIKNQEKTEVIFFYVFQMISFFIYHWGYYEIDIFLEILCKINMFHYIVIYSIKRFHLFMLSINFNKSLTFPRPYIFWNVHDSSTFCQNMVCLKSCSEMPGYRKHLIYN